jgi:hypothetical protein
MINYTTARGIQQERTRRVTNVGRSSSTVDWRRVGSTIAAGIATLAIVAATDAIAAEEPAQPEPVVTTVDDAPDEIQGGSSSVPLRAN